VARLPTTTTVGNHAIQALVDRALSSLQPHFETRQERGLLEPIMRNAWFAWFAIPHEAARRMQVTQRARARQAGRGGEGVVLVAHYPAQGGFWGRASCQGRMPR